MTDLPPVQYLDEAARAFGYECWGAISLTRPNVDVMLAHARALHENAQLRAEIAALRPRETLEQVARREADVIAAKDGYFSGSYASDVAFAAFLRAVEMAKAGELPDE